MNNDLKKTVHYTKNCEYICGNLKKYIKYDYDLIEPFVGNGDLLRLFNNKWEIYDLNNNVNGNNRDTLKNPPNYENKWVITNPPYLAKNKSEDKTIYNMYNIDDLYKAAILSIMNCNGGILIIPTNFFTDEKSSSVRKEFLSKFKVIELNIFNEPVFDSTTYSVCSFFFIREENTEQTIKVNIFPDNLSFNTNISFKYGYRIAGKVFYELENTDNHFSRLLLQDNENKKFITNIKLYAIDTRADKIHVEYDEKLFYGKSTDRTYATFVCDKSLSKDEQIFLINNFNEYLNNFRKEYLDIPMTNYRDYGRKRISFNFAYQILSYLLKQIDSTL